LPVQVRVETGQFIQPIVGRELKVVVPRDDTAGIQLEYRVPNSVGGPIKAGEQLGLVVVHNRDGIVTEAAALSPVSVNLPGDTLQTGDSGWNPAKPTAYNQTPQNQEPQ
jgi:hypothetical protein